MTVDKIYQILKCAEEKCSFDEYGYQEYIHGMIDINELAAAFVELYENRM